jgi:hypothetical protein
VAAGVGGERLSMGEGLGKTKWINAPNGLLTIHFLNSLEFNKKAKKKRVTLFAVSGEDRAYHTWL